MSEPVEALPVEDTETPIQDKLAYKGFVHVGDGATECPDNGAQCSDPDHFHAFCRLPNAFQQRDIRTKALAARARTIRRYHDQGSDAFEVIEADMDTLRRLGETESLVDELSTNNALEDLTKAIDEVKAEHADDYALVDEDIKRLAELTADGEPDEDEVAELERHTKHYWELVNAEVEERQRPLKNSLAQKPLDELIDLIREDRIEKLANAEFVHSYGLWRMALCTLQPGDRKTRVFSDSKDLHDADDEVVTTITTFFDELERGVPKG